MFGIEQKVEKAARKVAAFSLAGLFGTAGLAFLTAAAWIAMAEARSALFAASVIGTAYLGIALIAAAIGLRDREPPRPAPATTQLGALSPLQLVVVSFLQGLEQGRQTRR